MGVSYMYFGDQYLIRYMVCKYFLLLCKLYFHCIVSFAMQLSWNVLSTSFTFLVKFISKYVILFDAIHLSIFLSEFCMLILYPETTEFISSNYFCKVFKVLHILGSWHLQKRRNFFPIWIYIHIYIYFFFSNCSS